MRLRSFVNPLLALAGLGVAFAISELVLRAISPPFFDPADHVFHPEVGWLWRPHTVEYHQSGNRVVRLEINGSGFRDVEHTPQALVSVRGSQRRVRRIAVLGDSFSEAAQVDFHETFWSQLKQRLNERRTDSYWEIENYGVGDWGTTQQWISLWRFAVRHRPEIVVLQVFPFNDVLNNSIDAANLVSSQDAYRAYLDPARGYARFTYLNPTTARLRRHSAMFRYGFLVLSRRFGTWGREAVLTADERLERIAALVEETWKVRPERPLETLLFNAFAAPEDQIAMVRTGWAATEAAIGEIAETTRAIGAELVVLVIPHQQQLTPEVERWQRAIPYPFDPGYAESRLQEALGPRGIPVVLLRELFQERRDLVLPFVEGHLNAPTHALVADRLAETLRTAFPDLVVAPPDEAERPAKRSRRKRGARPET